MPAPISWRTWYEICLFTTPALIVYVMFVLVPIGFAVYYSLYRWHGIGPPTEFVGWPTTTSRFTTRSSATRSGTT